MNGIPAPENINRREYPRRGVNHECIAILRQERQRQEGRQREQRPAEHKRQADIEHEGPLGGKQA